MMPVYMAFTSSIYDATCSGMDDATYNRIEVVRLTNAPEDAVRFWIHQGLIRGPDLGRRKRLRFDCDEVRIASFLREARAIGMNVTAMRALVDKLREALELYRRFGEADLPEIDYALEIANGGDPVDVLSDHWRRPPNPEEIERFRWLAANLPFDQTDMICLGGAFVRGDDVFSVWLDENGDWQFRNGTHDGRLPAATVLAFDWSRICAIDWSRTGPA